MSLSTAAGIAQADHAPQAPKRVRTLDEEKSSPQSSSSNLSTDSPRNRQLEHTDTTFTTFESGGEHGLLFKDDGTLILMPAPTQDPLDPLNLPTWRKLLGLGCLCFFGALAASAELILGAMLPVFALEYADIDPKILLVLTEGHYLPKHLDPLVFLSQLEGAPPIWQTYLLGSLPLLVMGLSNLILVPAAITVGRRSVALVSGIIAIVGAIWAGNSQSLGEHIGGRCLQAIGAGTVESLIPFIIQDCVFFHKRNTAISGIFACQGAIIIGVGVAAPYCIINLSWRWVYFITAIAASVFLVGVFLFMPETRYYRTRAEIEGVPRPTSEEKKNTPRTWKYDLALMHGKFEIHKGVEALADSLRTFFYPHIFFITMLNSAMIAAAFAAAFTISPALLAPPYNWKFLNLGLCLIPVLIAAFFVVFVTGNIADKVANFFAKKRGRRLPENQLINLVLPTLAALVGTVLFGFAGQRPDDFPWPVFMLGLGLMAFGFLGANTVGAVYVLECYPQLAGPALVNISSFRCIIAFALSFKVAEWVVELGYLDAMIIYTGVMGLFALLLPVVYIFGPGWRRRWPGPNR